MKKLTKSSAGSSNLRRNLRRTCRMDMLCMHSVLKPWEMRGLRQPAQGDVGSEMDKAWDGGTAWPMPARDHFWQVVAAFTTVLRPLPRSRAAFEWTRLFASNGAFREEQQGRSVAGRQAGRYRGLVASVMTRGCGPCARRSFAVELVCMMWRARLGREKNCCTSRVRWWAVNVVTGKKTPGGAGTHTGHTRLSCLSC